MRALVIDGTKYALGIVVAVGSVLAAACGAAHGPVLDTGEKPPAVGGTIAGAVRAEGSYAPLSARRVVAIEVTTGRPLRSAHRQ
jgi:hypothetical protein